MALPQVGLEAVIAGLPGFEAGARTITKAYDDIERKGANVARASSSLSSSISSLASPFVSIGQSVLNFGAIAGGAALLGVGALTAGIGALGIAALGEVAKFERMSLSIQNLVAREISQGQVVEQQAQARIQLTQKEVAELEKLRNGLDNEANNRDVLTARIQEQKERIRQLTEQYGENGLVVIKERAELQGMELDLADLNGEIETNQRRITELTSKNGQLTTVLQKVRVGQISMSEAMTQASPKAQELLEWIQLLAIQSPFSQEGVAATFRTALAYGFTTEQAQRLTTAMVDFTAATGASEDVAGGIALALGQIRARGKLSAEELNQLSERGVGVNKVLEDMGFSLNDVTKGLVPVDKFLEAVIKDMEVFKGSAKAQSSTISGLSASLSDLKSIALREFFTGTFKSIQPYLVQFVDFLTKAAFETGSIKEIGNAIGQVVGKGLAKVAGWIQVISQLGSRGGLSVLNELFGPAVFPLWRELSDLVGKISLSFSGVGESLTGLMPSFSELSLIILPAITTALAFVNDHFEEFKGALLGIGAILAVGTFAAITAGLLSLLTPINLIIASAALLGAAWTGNWGGIQEKTLAVWGVIQPILLQIGQYMSNLVTAFQQGGLGEVFTKLQADIAAAIPGIMASLTTLATQFVTWANSSEVQAYLVQAGQMIGQHIANAISAFFTTGGPGAVTTVLTLATGLLAGVASIAGILFNLGANLVAGILAGILNSMGANLQPATLSQLGAILTSIGNNVKTIANYIGVSIVQGIQNGWNMLVGNVTEAFQDGVESWTNIIKETDWIDLGKNIVLGILEGITKNTYLVLKALKELAMEAVHDAMREWGIESPSTVFAEIGSNLVQGLMVGIDTKSQDFKNKLSTMLDEAIGLTQGLVESGMAGNSMRQMVRNVFRSVMTNTNQLGQLTGQSLANMVREQLKRFGYSIPAVERMMSQLGYNYDQMAQQLNETHSSLMRELRLEAAGQSIGRAGQFIALGQAAAERLKTRVKTLQELVNAGGGEYLGSVYTAVEAQDLLNAALTQQLDTQKEINALAQQQADLQFLQQQISVLKMVQDAGLDASQIFQGITFGLDASLPDLIAATSNVVKAMIDQINADLQIGSPSRVMVGIGKAIDSSLGKGLIDNISAPLSAARRMVEGVISVASGQVMNTSSTSNVTNNNFNMNVSALSSPQAVMAQFQVARAMV